MHSLVNKHTSTYKRWFCKRVASISTFRSSSYQIASANLYISKMMLLYDALPWIARQLTRLGKPPREVISLQIVFYCVIFFASIFCVLLVIVFSLFVPGFLQEAS